MIKSLEGPHPHIGSGDISPPCLECEQYTALCSEPGRAFGDNQLALSKAAAHTVVTFDAWGGTWVACISVRLSDLAAEKSLLVEMGNHLPPLTFLDTEQSGRRAKGKKSDSKRKGCEGSKGSPEKKEKVKAGPDSVLGQLALRCKLWEATLTKTERPLAAIRALSSRFLLPQPHQNRGLSTSFPIDGTFFNSWLAQSVQITAENMAMSEWPLNNGHREDPAPGLLSEELLQDEETLLSFMRDPSLRPGDPARKARGRTRLPAKKKPPPPPPPQDGPGSRTTPDKAPKKTWGQDAGSGKGGQGPPTRKPPRRTSSHLPSSPAAGDCPILAAPESPPPLAPETPDEAASVAADSDVQVPGPAASPKPLGRLRPPRESKVTRRLSGSRPDAGTGPPLAVAERPKVSLHFDAETDGYFSDGEMSDSDVEAEDGGVQRGPREAGAEEVVRMGVLAS
ncbi:E3 ubiquitin-protein ligase Jade-2 [Saguinus oedipus]|uniref:E3 ubiquitin-protein ligase Jade-2 n=1 Tax=Saguinus oedipus TaxID=9490 RepID=A0ABQ9W5M6_SAGOE|nr:E3 ubiquitin-protein ligase Jade-2 [Saguinus oedipus]